MKHRQRSLNIGSGDPDWLAFIASGQNQPRTRRKKHDAAIETIRAMKVANQQRLREADQ